MLLSKPMLGQQFFRVKADFSIKEILPSGKSSLTMGTVYFDKTAKRLVYQIKFPQKETIVVNDSLFYHFVDGNIIEKKPSLNILSFSIFNLALSSKMSNFGLDGNPAFKLVDVTKEDSLIISTWSPAVEKLKEITGNVLISQKKKQLFGLVFFDKDGKLLSKQFFEEYKNFKGLEFPGIITQINFLDGKEFYKITTFKNVVVNDMNENTIYNYSIPVQ